MYLWVLVCVCALPISILSYIWWSGRRARLLSADLPGWPQLPLFGNALQFYGGPQVILRRVMEMSEKSEKSNSMFKVWFGPQFFVVMFKPEDTKIITSSFIEKPYYYRFGSLWLGDGLVTGPGYVWKRMVKYVSTSFAGTVIEGFQDIFNYQAKKLVNNFKSEVGKPPFDAFRKYLAYSTLETICQTAMGVPDIGDSIVTSEYYEAFDKTLKLIIYRAFNIFLHPDFIFKLTPSYQEFKKSIKVLHNVSNTVIARKRKEYNEKKRNGMINTEEKKTKFRPFLDILIELSDEDPLLTDDQIRAEVDTVIVGGQETTATTLSFTLLMLGSHKDVQDKLYNEIKSIFGDSKRSVEKEDLAKMKYCEAVLLESLRLYPPIPAVMRFADTDVKLEKYTIPANTVCVVNAFGAGRSKRLWGSDADQYRPDRWMENNNYNPAALLAFSYGRRSCIGKKYALTFLKTVLSHCVRDLTIHSDIENLELGFDVALRAIKGNLIEFKER